LWDVATHRPSGSLPTGPTAPVSSVAFSPDGATLAAGSADGVWLWGLPTPCNCLTSPTSAARLTGPAGAVNSVVFSPDGKTLAAGSGDGTVQLWDMATEQQIATLTRHHGTVTPVAFSTDGRTLAAGSGDGTVQLWDVAYLVNAVPRLCASAGRSLTRAEWARYVPGLAYQKVCP
jgi:WD40 repeat protein